MDSSYPHPCHWWEIESTFAQLADSSEVVSHLAMISRSYVRISLTSSHRFLDMRGRGKRGKSKKKDRSPLNESVLLATPQLQVSNLCPSPTCCSRYVKRNFLSHVGECWTIWIAELLQVRMLRVPFHAASTMVPWLHACSGTSPLTVICSSKTFKFVTDILATLSSCLIFPFELFRV